LQRPQALVAGARFDGGERLAVIIVTQKYAKMKTSGT
jgi:hypothetical protein